MVKGIGYFADDLKADLLPEFDGDSVAFDDEIELHRGESKPLCFVERIFGHLSSDALPG